MGLKVTSDALIGFQRYFINGRSGAMPCYELLIQIPGCIRIINLEIINGLTKFLLGLIRVAEGQVYGTDMQGYSMQVWYFPHYQAAFK